MIDLHCHLLPGLDDGAQTLEEALDMARLALADGITDIIATPHTHDGRYLNLRTDVQEAVRNLRVVLQREGLPLRVHAGAEVHLHDELMENLFADDILTLCDGCKYLLLELPTLSIPAGTDSLIHELLTAGITPLLAHPERNRLLAEQPHRLAEWIAQGAVAQLTGGSLLGKFGRRAQVAAERMVRLDLVQVLASDGHRIARRRPRLSEAYQALEALTSTRTVQLYQENARVILQGEPCAAREPHAAGKRKRFGWFS